MEFEKISGVGGRGVWALLFVVTLCGQVAWAAYDRTVRLFGEGDMVAGNYTAFCEDVDGYVWIGTDVGVLRFDGNQSDIFRNDELNNVSLSDNRVSKLFCDSRGCVWVGTVNGLNRFNRSSFTFKRVKLPDTELNGFIGDIAELEDGRIIFLVSGVGLYILTDVEGGDINVERYYPGLENESQFSAILDLGRDGMLITCRSGIVYLLSGGGNMTQLGTINGNANRVGLESSGNVILSSQFEVYRLDLTARTLRRLDIVGDERIKICDVFGAEDGVIFFATTGNGLWEVRDGSDVVERTKRLYSSSLNLEKLKIGNGFKDNDGNLWIGCNHKGVAMVPSKKMPFFSKKLEKIHSGIEGEIQCLEVVGENVVVGLTTGRLLVTDLEGNYVRMIDVPGRSLVTSVVADGVKQAFLGVVRDGIWRLDLETFRLTKLTDIDKPYPGVLLSITDSGDIIAAASEAGVMKYNCTTGEKVWYTPETDSDALTTYYYAGICKTSDDMIWIGGYSGISCYDAKKGAFISLDQGPFINVAVHSVCDGNDGNVMIATSRGLLEYKPGDGVVKKYTVLDGLADNDVRTLVADRKGGIWVGTINGLSYLPKDGTRLQSYTATLGLTEKSYVHSRPLRNNRLLVMGGYEGFTFFNPDSISPTSFGGSIRVSGMFLNGHRITATTVDDDMRPVIKGDGMNPEALYLSYQDKSLVLRLSTMDFRNTSRLRYEWQLNGDGDVWSSTQPGENFVYLPSLNPGKYTLRIRGWEDNACSDISELELNISKPWYLADVAKVSYALVGLIIIGLLYKVVKSKRYEELYEAKIKFFMDISHEIRSPITLLLNPVDALLKQPQTPQTIAQLLTVRRNAQRVLSLADQLLDLRRIEKRKMRLVYSRTDLCGFISELVDMFRPQAQDKGLEIEFACQEKEIEASVDRDNLDKILVNLISNAVKYTPDGGKINVDLSLTKDDDDRECYQIKVTDTGIGLDNKLMAHLFERFWRDRDRHYSPTSGFGIGLDLCLRLVELHGGKISGKNREDGVKGSVFTVVLPLLPVKNSQPEHSHSTAVSVNDTSSTGKNNRRSLLNAVAMQPREVVKQGKNSTRIYVMVVDDDAELREYIKENLGPGYKVNTFSNGEAALKALAERLPDIVVTDIRMDGMDGFELLKKS